MADYGIFGHGSSGNSWFANTLNKVHGKIKEVDPIGAYSVENPLKSAHYLVEKSSKGLADAGIGEGFNRRLNQEANENGNNFGLGSQRMGVGILSYLGGAYGAEALGGGGSGGLGAGDGAFLGEGVSSGVPAWDGAAGGMGLGFDPGGLPQGSSFASDIPGGGNSPFSGLGGMGGGGGQSGEEDSNELADQLQARLDQQAEMAYPQPQQPQQQYINQTPLSKGEQLALLLQQRAVSGQGYA